MHEKQAASMKSDQTTKALKERIKEKTCLFNISRLNEVDLSIEQILRESIREIKTAFQYPNLTELKITYQTTVFQSENYQESDARITAKSIRDADHFVIIEVILAGFDSNIKLGFLAEEQELIEVVADILNQKFYQQRTRYELKESLERYEFVFKAADDVIYDHDIVNDTIKLNENFEKIFGYSFAEEEFTLEKWALNLHPDDQKKINRRLDAVLTDPNTNKWEAEFRYARNDGTYAHVFENSYIIRDKNGRAVRMIGTVKDITEIKQRELTQKLVSDVSRIFNQSDTVTEALQKSLNQISEIGSFPLGEIWMVNDSENKIELKVTLQNKPEDFYKKYKSKKDFKKGEGLPGFTWNAGKFQYWKNLQHRKLFVRKKLLEPYGLQSAYGFPIIYRGKTFGVLVLGTSEAPPKPGYYTPILIEIAVQLGDEINRKKLEEELARVFSSAPDIICTANFAGYFTKINPAASELLGYSEEELLTQPFLNFIHPDDKEKTLQELSELQQESAKSYLINRYITKSGKIIWISWSAKIFYDEKIVYAVAKDVTEEKELEILHEQATRLARIGSWELDVIDGRLYWSNITKEIHEVSRDYEPALETAIHFYKEGYHREKIGLAVEKALHHGTSFDLELIIITAQGNEKWIRAIGEAELINGKCVRLYGSMQDIHSRKIIDERIKTQASHIDAIAKLNSALIDYHDWYNALDRHLVLIGAAVNADRVYYFENRFDAHTGEGYTTQKLEWCREGITKQMDNPDLQELPFRDVPELVQPMLNNQPSMAIWSDIEENTITKYVMKDQDIKAYLAFPVMVKGRFHGFVGFDNCTEERYWSEEDITTLGTITSNLAVSIERHETDMELQASLIERNIILESISDAFYAVDNEWKFTYFNREAEKILKKKAKHVLHKSLWDVFAPAADTDLFEIYHSAVENKQTKSFEYYYPELQQWFEISAYPSQMGLSVYFKNISGRKRDREKIINKTRQLDSIATFNSSLIQEETWQLALQKNLEFLGAGVDADRVYYFENHREKNSGEWLTSMKFEWVKDHISPELNREEHHDVPFELLGDFIEVLQSNKPYQKLTKEIKNEEFKNILEKQEIKSVLAIPVFVHGSFEGFLGFDDCTTERKWTKEEISYLKTISLNLATAIESQASEMALHNAFDEKNEILESIGDGFFTVDRNFTVTYWNKNAEKLLLTSRENIIGKCLWDYFDKNLASKSYQNYINALNYKEKIKFEDYYPPVDRWFDVNVYPTPNGISIFFKDITDEKHAENQLIYKSRLIKTIADVNSILLAYDDWFEALHHSFGIIGDAVRVDRVYYFKNHKDEQTGEIYSGQKLEWTRDIITPQINNLNLKKIPIHIFPEFFDPLKENKVYAVQVSTIKNRELKKTLEQQGILSLLVIPMFINNEFWGFVGFDDCTSERIWTDEDISFLRTVTFNLASALEKREANITLVDLYHQLENKAKELESINSELEQFAFIASHDLQEPLRMVTSFLTQLERKYGDDLDEKGKRYIYFAVDGAKRMRQIILDLLHFSRVGKIDDDHEEVDLNQIIDNYCVLRKKLIEEKSAKILKDDLPVLNQKKSPLIQLFHSLLDNALYYSKDHEPPVVYINYSENEQEWIFSITDNGIGINEEYFEKIFLIFQRLHEKSESGGSGLGLAIVKKIIDSLGGKIWVESEMNEGSTFYFTLPKTT